MARYMLRAASCSLKFKIENQRIEGFFTLKKYILFKFVVLLFIINF